MPENTVYDVKIKNVEDQIKIAHKRIDETRTMVKENEDKIESEIKEVRKDYMAELKSITQNITDIKDDVSKTVVKAITKLLAWVFTVFGAAIIGLAIYIITKL